MLQLTLYQAVALIYVAGLAQGVCVTRILQTNPPSKLAETLSLAGALVVIPVLEVLDRFGNQVAP